jgi:small-conductance mechanosensitive channel
MFGWVEIVLLSLAAALLVLRALPYVQQYRALCTGGAALALITALFPRTGNPLGQFLFGPEAGGLHLPRELFGIIWWCLGAWLFSSLLGLLLRRTLFPDNDKPQARRLFADLASGLIYVLAFVGIVGTVFHQPVSAFLATSGVMAIVLGLALQNTLGDVLSGLSINIEHPFVAGDWVTLPDGVTGQVMQVNWRATRVRTWSHDMIVIPNSAAARAVVTNHSRPAGPHRCLIRLAVDGSVAPDRVIAALELAAARCPDVSSGTAPQAYAWAFAGGLVTYELAFAIDSFALTIIARSHMIIGIAETFRSLGIPIGNPATEVRILAAPGPGEAQPVVPAG